MYPDDDFHLLPGNACSQYFLQRHVCKGREKLTTIQENGVAAAQKI